ncbi:PEP-CTERM sorting domain-containing protein [Colwellia sp. BRX10-6]|uniref:PEP-CTERM sorting domain-containing protein n=1 Tax=unclassified Colwellia TaxID=196834 RepID=UPI0015F783A1|nr:PEP-CTERM sorting domain-containing protein [Colwellia sp. BRX8-9]MBA6353158.1 PEP-CTERM sorting domain-containing protein [Colwellia sp. BRX9-1]MBA6383860.1 PEP-CTERM sorting domain-containing protein [Colwellia sp. BRX10-9]MBA6393897.1 PEP-CTERM sorting domain-containing protein [Colwellia sp. BRX10-6]
MNESCGGVFSVSSTVAFAATISIIGHQGCGAVDVPEPATIWLLGLGSGLNIAMIVNRKHR